MKLIFFVLAFVSAGALFAQKEGNTWVMPTQQFGSQHDSTCTKIKCDTTLKFFFK